MNDEIRKILKWGFIGGVIAAGITVLVSSGMPIGIRVTCALMAFGAGVVTAALLAANFAKEEADSPEEAGSH
jgi:hypothetical protein